MPWPAAALRLPRGVFSRDDARRMDRDLDDAEDDARIGQSVGKYEITQLLGRGGMGRVYEAINPTIGKRVVVKMLHPDVAAHRDAVARFHREAQAASAAESPHIVSIFDAGFADDGAPFIVMELLRGETLAARLRRDGTLDATETTRIMVQVLRGLSRAHAAGITHRDLKPDNIFLVDRDPEPTFAKILDFGVSKIDRAGNEGMTLTREGVVLGTPAYMSPEQAQGLADVDARSDVWSVGAILYECLAGQPPFSGATYEQIIVRICGSDPKPLAEIVPSVPVELAEVVSACLRREREDRVGSASELIGLLGEGTSTPRIIRTPSVSPIALTPTLEARGEQDLTPPSPRGASLKILLPVGLFVASGAIAGGALLRGEDDGVPTRAEASGAGLSASPVASEGEQTASGPPSGAATGSASSEASGAEPTAGSPSTSVSTSATSAAPTVSVAAGPRRPAPTVLAASASASPPAPTVQPSAPKGVAGDLQIQRK